jgi:hypothetical protein
MKYILIFYFIFFSCDLQNRYPEKGDFCVPMQEIPECIEIDFRANQLILEKKEIQLNQISRVQYEFKINEILLYLEVLSEHRVQIRNEENKKIYRRKKGPKISIWSRIKKAYSGIPK